MQSTGDDAPGPVGIFHDPGWAMREHPAVFLGAWVPVAASVELARVGQVLPVSLGPYPVLLTRSASGIYAFHNVCTHRGHPLCTAPELRDHLLCPYHHLEFSLGGTCLREGSPRTGIGPAAPLAALRIEERAGLVFVCASEAQEPLDVWLGDLGAVLDAQRLDLMGLTNSVRTELACNWKLSVEVHLEAAHVPTLHPAVVGVVDAARAEITQVGRHGLMRVPLGRGHEEVLGPASDARREAAARARWAALRQGGVDVAPLPWQRLQESVLLHLFPNVQLNAYGDSVLLFRHAPHPSDPTRCVFEQHTFALQPKGTSAVAQTRWVAADDAAFGPVTSADLAVAARLQASVHSPAFRPRYARPEALIAHFLCEVATQVAARTVSSQSNDTRPSG